MPHTAEFSALLTDYLVQLDHRRIAVADLRRDASALGPRARVEVLPVLDLLRHTAETSDESARALLRWLEAGAN